MHVMNDPTFTPSGSLSVPKRTTHFGMLRRRNWSAKDESTITFACCGERKSWNGRGLPQKALEIMVELNNKYALDGRDPNSYSGIFWCLGRYDRPWGPERPVFGTVRYMSSENTARKFNVRGYVREYDSSYEGVTLEK